jgi:hypothetical protein
MDQDACTSELRDKRLGRTWSSSTDSGNGSPSARTFLHVFGMTMIWSSGQRDFLRVAEGIKKFLNSVNTEQKSTVSCKISVSILEYHFISLA